MPEIHDEIPSDIELAEYLQASLASSAFDLLDTAAQFPNRYAPAHVEALQYLSSCAIRKDFYSGLRASLFLALKRLNQLPRTDPFWSNTNRRPTLYKLPAFCERTLSANPHDIEALLAITALAVISVGEFRQGRWTQLLGRNAVSAKWVVFAAMLMEMTGSVDTHHLAECAKAAGREAEVVSELNEAARNGGAAIAGWANQMLTLLAQPPAYPTSPY